MRAFGLMAHFQVGPEAEDGASEAEEAEELEETPVLVDAVAEQELASPDAASVTGFQRG